MLVWLHDDFPGPTAVSCLDHPAILHDILPVARCSFKHSPEIDLREAAILHGGAGGITSRTVSPVPFVPDVAPLVVPAMVRLAVRALPRAPAAPVVTGAPAPFAVPAPDAVRGRVVVRVNRVNHDARARPRHHDAGGQQQRSSANHRPSRLHRTLQTVGGIRPGLLAEVSSYKRSLCRIAGVTFAWRIS